MTQERPLIENTAKKKLKAGGAIKVFNVFESLRPAIVKTIAHAGYDMILIETEHVLHNNESLTNFIVMARDNGLCPAVTIPAPERDIVSRLLDAGAMGFVLSHAETPEQMEAMVRWMKYPPEGKRGLALGPNADYKANDVARYCREANEATLLLLKIEEYQGVENAEAMLSNKWVDGIVFGPGDLASDMGFHGQWEHPEVLAAIERAIEVALAKGKATEPAISATTAEEYRRHRERGIQLFGPARRTEWDILGEAARKIIEPFK